MVALAPLLPNKPRGGARVDDRRVISGIIHVLRSGRRRRAAGQAPARQLGGEGAPLCGRRQRGELSQAVGRSRGGRTTKIHALADGAGRPLAFLLTGGQAADCRAAEPLLERVPAGIVVHADKGYDTDRVRSLIEGRGSAPNIPPRCHRRWKNCFSPFLYTRLECYGCGHRD